MVVATSDVSMLRTQYIFTVLFLFSRDVFESIVLSLAFIFPLSRLIRVFPFFFFTPAPSSPPPPVQLSVHVQVMWIVV